MLSDLILSCDQINWSNYKYGIRVSNENMRKVNEVVGQLKKVFNAVEFFWGDHDSYYYLCELRK